MKVITFVEMSHGYFIPNKIYDVEMNHDQGGWIETENAGKVWVSLKESMYLDGGDWEIVE